jgi:hypothetical protein
MQVGENKKLKYLYIVYEAEDNPKYQHIVKMLTKEIIDYYTMLLDCLSDELTACGGKIELILSKNFKVTDVKFIDIPFDLKHKINRLLKPHLNK